MTDVVAVDIGGTHARFALARVDGGRVVDLHEPVTLKTSAFASLRTAWESFAEDIGQPLPRAAAIAVAGPVSGSTLKLTNNSWLIAKGTLKDELGIDRYALVNDFEAVGHAVAQVGDEHLEHLCGPASPLPPRGTISVLGPGTGLGVAHVWRDGSDYRVQAAEGGHIDFAPIDAIDDGVLARLRLRHRRVSVERVVSGPGLVEIHEALAAIEGRSIPQYDDKTLWSLGLEGGDALASAAIDRFTASLGSVAGDMALAHGASGVVIAGGLGLRIKERLRHSGFGARFRAKGRFEHLMASLPVKLITHPQPGLFGAAAAFARGA